MEPLTDERNIARLRMSHLAKWGIYPVESLPLARTVKEQQQKPLRLNLVRVHILNATPKRK